MLLVNCKKAVERGLYEWFERKILKCYITNVLNNKKVWF